MIIASCQIHVQWEKPRENIVYCDNLLKVIAKQFPDVDIVVFPEFFTYGFSVEGNIFEESEGMTFKWLRESAVKYGFALSGSVPVLENGNLYNRAYFVTPENQVSFYDKRHLFSYGGENKKFSPGSELEIIDYKGFRIALQICYDLRFPVYIRNTGNKYDLVINVASWPSSREKVIEPMVRSRAIENVCYYAFVNRSGSDPYGLYNPSGIISDYLGEILNPVSVIKDYNCTIYNLDRSSLEKFRSGFRPWEDADTFQLNI